ncbi:TLD-domain-containing protein [Coprinopsis sp. MPI-PUGE-AT-0042]|nr:TLD-domain-containing protein [Coprinopsis sp. MPI-PUGE-AT-0042]
MDSMTKDSAQPAGPQLSAQQGSTGTSTPTAFLEGASSIGEPIIDGDDQEFGSFVEASPVSAAESSDPLSALAENSAGPTTTGVTQTPLSSNIATAGPLGALESLKPPQQKHNLIDEIMEYERNPSSLFTDEKAHSPRPTTPSTSIADEFSKMALPSQPQPVTALEEDPNMTAAHRLPSPAHPPAFDPILDPLSAAQNIQTPEPGSGLTPAPMPQLPPLRSRKSVEPTAKGGGVAIEENLGLIDQDYFASREPAEAIPIVTTPLASTGLSTPRGDSQPPRSPGWSLKSMISSQLSSPSHSREHTREPSSRAAQEERHVTTTHHHHHHHRRQPSSPTLPHVLPAPPILTPGVNRDLLDLDLIDEHSDSLPTPHPLDLPTPVPVPPPDPDQWLDVPQSQSTRGSPSAQSYGTLSRIPSWIGSLLGGAAGESEDTVDGPHSKTRRDSDSSTTSSFHSDRRIANAYGASPSPISTPTLQARNLPAPSQSTIRPAGLHPVVDTNMYMQLYSSNHKSRSRSRPSHSPVARQREAQHEPVNITHSTPFAPSPPAGASSLATPYSAPLNVGFSPMVKSHTLPTTAGPSSSANPFGTPTFTPIPGAPGFKPNEYDWDKGFSDELEQEMRGNDYDGSRRPRMPKTPEDDSTSGGLGSIFGFGSFRQKSSSDRVHSTPPPHLSPGPSQPYAYGHSRTATEPTQSSSVAGTSGKDRLMYATSRPIQKSNSRGSTAPPTVSQLIEKKVGSIVLKERKASTEAVLNQELADLIRPHLPPLSRLPKSWTLLYSLDQHGISLNTLYNNCEAPLRNRKHGQNYVGMGGVLLVLRDSETSEQSVDGTFGAFIAEGLGRKSKGFFGGGDSFLWKYSNGALQVFKASGRNTYFAICESGYMAFGGGSTSYGLYIDSGLLEGYSAPSVTFGNETLCNPTSETLPSASRPGTQAAPSQQSSFECVGLEVWGVGPT